MTTNEHMRNVYQSLPNPFAKSSKFLNLWSRLGYCSKNTESLIGDMHLPCSVKTYVRKYIDSKGKYREIYEKYQPNGCQC